MIHFKDISWYLRTRTDILDKQVAYIWPYFPDLSHSCKLDFKGEQHDMYNGFADNSRSIRIAFEI